MSLHHLPRVANGTSDFLYQRTIACVFAGLLTLLSAVGAEEAVPSDSVIGRAGHDCQRLLLNPLDDAASVATGAWKMRGTYVTAAGKVPPKLGGTALTLGAAEAQQAGAKGDFRVDDGLPGTTQTIGLWAHLEKDANVARMGVQVHDSQGEVLLVLVPAEWTGWRWVEVDLAKAKQAYPQADKNRVIDYPLKGVHVVWFTKAAGPTSLTVDAVIALTRLTDAGNADVTVDSSVPDSVEAGGRLHASVCATNYTGQATPVIVRYSLQRDPSLYSAPLPDPVFGSNHAAGTHSWLVVDGKRIEDSRSTDNKPWTAATTSWQRDHYTQAQQFVDLGQTRQICKLTWRSGDANHAWLVDVRASEDGENFVPAPGLGDVDQHKLWGWREFPVERPFTARLLEFRYKTTGGREDLMAFPSELGIYDGTDDETVALPKVGATIEEGLVRVDVPARSFALQALEFSQTLQPGAYLLGLSVERQGPTELSYRHVFCSPRERPESTAGGSRIGMNTANADLAPRLRELGIGFVRFENGKWPFVSAQPHQYSFTGDVAPWHVNVDQIFQAYRNAGFEVLTYLFLTPTWASSVPADAPGKMRLSFPPKELSSYGEFCFQMAARYGSKEHPEDQLLTPDKRSGLNLVKYYEMWNEPNLNPSPKATWGGWAAPMDKYYEMMRFGAEAVKRADPDAVVTSAGYAGISTDVVDPLRTFRYADGKCPLDFADVINVHFYSGQEPPETCQTDGNANITSTTTFPENLRELTRWRDRYAPGKPIWMTETGYDSAGPFGTTEAIQAARLPRVVMLCLANGVEKVFVYRESGSTPSKHACSGILRDDFSRKPAWYTLGTAIRQLRGIQGGAKRLPHPEQKVWLMEWNGGGKPLLSAWTVDGTARLGIDLGGCTVTDSFGGVTSPDSTEETQITPYPQYFRDFVSIEPLNVLRDEYQRQETARLARLERIAALRKYLFDFGSTEQVGRSNIEGHRTDYLPVLSTALFSQERGWGFDKPALGDEDQPWLRGRKLDRDGTRVRGQVFRFRVQPGQYDLQFSVVPFREQSQVIVTGIDGGPLTLAIQNKTPVQNLRISVTGQDPVIGIQVKNDYGHFRWVSCVEVLDP